MPNAAKKVVVAALATGGIVAGVATASAAPLSTPSPAAATSAEEAHLHELVVGLTAKEQTLQTALRARHHARPTTTVAPAGPVVTEPGVAAGTTRTPQSGPEPAAPAAPVAETATGGGPTTAEPTTEPSSVPSTEPPEPEADPPTTTTSTTGTVPNSPVATRPDDGGGHGTND